MASCAPKCDFCHSCMTRETKYICIQCGVPICNICSRPEDNEEIRGWLAGRSVGYCNECSNEGVVGLKDRIVGKTTPKTLSRLEATAFDNETDDESLASGDGDDALLNTIKGKRHKTKKRPGRKAQWPESLLNDLVDIIANDEYFKKKLIFTNTRNQKNAEIYEKVLTELKKRAADRNENCTYTAVQLRTKFKKTVAECKKAAMLMKSGSGIKRFQDERGYGMWFNQLFALVKTRESCQPEQAIEPSATSSSEQPLEPSADSPATTSSDSQEIYVPVPAKRRKTRKESQFHDLMDMMKTIVEKDPMSDFLNFAREEAEKSRQHELKLMQLLMAARTQPQPQQPFQTSPQQANYTNIQGQQHMDNYSSYYQF